MRLLCTICLVLCFKAGADQSLTMSLGKRGQIDLKINASGAIVGLAKPNMQDFVNRLLQPSRDPVEITLARNINGLDGPRLGFFRATDLLEVDGSIFAVVRDKGASTFSPSYLAKLDVQMNDPVAVGLSALTVGSLVPMGYAIARKFNSMDPLPLAAAITAVLALVVWEAKEFLNDLRKPSGWARPMQSNSSFVRVDSLVHRDDKLVDVLITPVETVSKTEPKSLRSLLTPGCGQELVF